MEWQRVSRYCEISPPFSVCAVRVHGETWFEAWRAAKPAPTMLASRLTSAAEAREICEAQGSEA